MDRDKIHKIIRRHLDSANLLCAREDVMSMTPVEKDALANLITDEIMALPPDDQPLLYGVDYGAWGT